VKRLVLALAVLGALVSAGSASAAWSLVGTNAVASSPVAGGGYPVPPGSTKPLPGTCGPQMLNSNHSESWLAVKPGTEDIVGDSKFFIGKWSTFYDFHLGSYTILDGSPVSNNQVQGYECTTVGTQAMPPSWTNNTDPNVDFDTGALGTKPVRAYMATLPFNAFWGGGLHPNGEIDVSYSDNMGALWQKGNGGKALDSTNNQTSLAFGHVEDKQWIAVNHFPLSRYHDHVYAMWTTFNGASGGSKIMVAVSRDRGQTFSRAVQLTTPSATGPANTYVYPSVSPDGTVYVAFVSGFDTTNKNRVGHVYVTKSVDDGRTWGPFVLAATPIENPLGYFPPTNFRDGIIENFAASPTYPGHVYLTYENWDLVSNHSDVYFTQSTDGGLTWSTPSLVNDDGDPTTDQFQPSVAAGPGGAVAVAFYDRRAACPSDPSIIPAHVGDANTCIDVSLQPYKDSGTAAGAVPVGGNVRVSQFAWDPDQPAQKVDGISQYPCAGHNDPCPTGRGFIGDYFGLAISSGNIYTLAVSTHYPGPGVTADGGGPVYYQQQVLGKVPRSTFGAGF
jgi:hypothetical protein